MELMNENIALNDIDFPRTSEDVIDVPEFSAGTVSLSAKTLDWDADLPSWVTSNHPDIVVYVPVIPPYTSMEPLTGQRSRCHLQHRLLSLLGQDSLQPLTAFQWGETTIAPGVQAA